MPAMAELSDFDRGLLVGLLIGEGSFGGDGKQPQVTLRMHVRHEAIFRWLLDRYAAFIGRERARLHDSSAIPSSDAER